MQAMPTSIVPLNACGQHASFAYAARLCNPDAPGCPGWGPTFLWLSSNANLAAIHPHVPADMTAEVFSITIREFRAMKAEVAEWLTGHCEDDALADAPRIIGISPMNAGSEMPVGLSTIAI